MSDTTFFIIGAILIVLFAGDPDLHDRIIARTFECPTLQAAP